jgi:hypothetical protein
MKVCSYINHWKYFAHYTNAPSRHRNVTLSAICCVKESPCFTTPSSGTICREVWESRASLGSGCLKRQGCKADHSCLLLLTSWIVELYLNSLYVVMAWYLPSSAQEQFCLLPVTKYQLKCSCKWKRDNIPCRVYLGTWNWVIIFENGSHTRRRSLISIGSDVGWAAGSNHMRR